MLKLGLVGGVALCSGVAGAAVVQYASRAAFDAAYAGSVFEDFESFAPNASLGTGFVSGGATFSVDNVGDNRMSMFGFANNQLSRLGNGTAGFADFGSGPEVLTIAFDTPQTAFGFDINGSEVAGDFVVMLDTGDVILSVVDVVLPVPYTQFVGFESDVAFSSLTIENRSRVQAATYDNFRAAVPGPGGLVVTGLGVVLVASRRR